ncbi:hypothetical protein KDA82_19315, partial [Streptomyces daliensis]|nr:hypothetical protein [Streptomyces daliensis]
GLGFESALVGEHNAFTLPDTIAPYRVIHPWVKGAAMTESGNYVNGDPFDVLRYYNTQNPVALVVDVRAQARGPARVVADECDGV